MYKLDLEETEKSEIKFPTSFGSENKQENSSKNIYFCFIDYTKHLTMWMKNCGKLLKRREHQTTLTVSCETCLKIKNTGRTVHGTKDWFKIGKGVHQFYIMSPVYLTSLQSTSCKMLGWMKHKLESRLLGKISIASDRQMTPSLWQKVKRN